MKKKHTSIIIFTTIIDIPDAVRRNMTLNWNRVHLL